MPTALSKNKIKYLAFLRHKKYRQLEEKFLIEGTRMCEEALQSDFIIEALFVTKQFTDSEPGSRLVAKAQECTVEIVKVSSTELAKFTDTVHTPGVSALIRMPSLPAPTDWPDSAILLALDAISDPGNLGTVIRTADWFAVDAVLLGHSCVELYNPKVLRSTMGSVFHLPIFENTDLVQELTRIKRAGVQICAGHAHVGMPLKDFDRPSKMALLVGSESRGIDEQLTSLIDDFVHIPKFGQAESLNVATATGILLFAITATKKG